MLQSCRSKARISYTRLLRWGWEMILRIIYNMNGLNCSLNSSVTTVAGGSCIDTVLIFTHYFMCFLYFFHMTSVCFCKAPIKMAKYWCLEPYLFTTTSFKVKSMLLFFWPGMILYFCHFPIRTVIEKLILKKYMAYFGMAHIKTI